MLTYEKFRTYMEAILVLEHKETTLSHLFPGYCGELSSDLICNHLDLISECMGQKDTELLSWWMWDSNGRENAVIVYPDGSKKRLDNLAALYDFMVEEAKA